MIAVLLVASIGMTEYRARLQAIDASLAAGHRALAAREAQALLKEKVSVGGEEFAPDARALEPIARDEPHRARLRTLLDALPGAPARSAAPDRALLEELRRAQEATPLTAGGDLAPIDVPRIPLWQEVLDSLERGARWLLDRIADLWRWIEDLFPNESFVPRSTQGRITLLVLVGVGFIVALVVSLALLTSRKPAPRGVPSQSRRQTAEDDDPLSRSATGWEAYARELASQGRARHAIRAWYHALLLRCFGAGVLHHHKGRTNWEYALALSPSLPWRQSFLELTRSFDREWYGHAESTPEALGAFVGETAKVLRALGAAP